MQAHPSYLGRQPATPTPVCGTRDLAMPGQPPCGQPATVHIKWENRPHFKATLHCATHADHALTTLAWYEQHPAGPACSSPSPTWHPNHCTQE